MGDVLWFDAEVEAAAQVYEVDVSEFKWNNGEGGIVETLSVADLTNDEIMILQQDPLLKKYPGSVGTEMSPKAQAFGILLTFQRMYKGNPNLGFTVHKMLKWSTARTGKLIRKISETLGEVQKKIDDLPDQTPDNSSETL